jgi:O-antigen/teichoic acid export membrane protein
MAQIEQTEQSGQASAGIGFLTGVLDKLRALLGEGEEGRASAFAALKVLIIRCGGAGLAYATQVLLARLLGQTEYGVFALVWVWILVLGHLTPMGFSQSVCRFAPHYHARKEQELLRGFLQTGALVVAFFACATALLGGALLWFAAPLFDNIYLLPLTLALLTFPLFALQDYVENVARAFNWTITAIAPPFLIRNGLVVVGLLTAFLVDIPMTAGLAVSITFGAVLVSLLVQTAMVWHRLRKQLPLGAKEHRVREWFRTALPLVFVDGTLVLLTNADVLILSLFVEPAIVGIYFAATRIIQIVGFVQYAATVATAQKFTALNAMGDHAALATLANTTTRLTLLVSASAAVGIYLISPFLLALFGEGYDTGLPALAVLMLGLIIQAAAGPGEDLLNMLGHERACATVYVVSLVINVVLNFALIPSFGILGAAFATTIAMGIRSLTLTWLVQQKLDLNILFSFRRTEATS